MERKARISEVARRAGVSPATVSRYVSGRQIRSASAVQAAIEDLGYSTHAVAKSLKTGRTGNVGVIVPDITNPYFASVVKGIEAASRRHAYNILLCNTDDNVDRQEHAIEALAGVVDGLILTPAIESRRVPSSLGLHQGPTVLLDRDFGEPLECDTVRADNVGGAQQVAQYLTEIGHRRIGFISGPLDCTPGRQRHEGFLDGMRAAGIELDPGSIYYGDFRETGGYLGMKSLLAGELPTAVFVANNLMAMGVLRACRESKLSIPTDLSFVAFDDLALGDLIEPAITTVSRQTMAEGALALSLLAERLEGGTAEPPRHCVLDARLSIRDSCSAPASRLRSAV